MLTDPETVGRGLQGVRHLLVRLLDRRRLDPLVVAGVADVVDVVVDASTAGTVALRGDRYATDIAPATRRSASNHCFGLYKGLLVVGPEKGDVVRDGHALLIVALNLRVQAPDLRNHGAVGGAEHVSEDRTLIFDNTLEQGQVERRTKSDCTKNQPSERTGRESDSLSPAPRMPRV
jgi:hypothetical protein